MPKAPKAVSAPAALWDKFQALSAKSKALFRQQCDLKGEILALLAQQPAARVALGDGRTLVRVDNFAGKNTCYKQTALDRFERRRRGRDRTPGASADDNGIQSPIPNPQSRPMHEQLIVNRVPAGIQIRILAPDTRTARRFLLDANYAVCGLDDLDAAATAGSATAVCGEAGPAVSGAPANTAAAGEASSLPASSAAASTAAGSNPQSPIPNP